MKKLIIFLTLFLTNCATIHSQKFEPKCDNVKIINADPGQGKLMQDAIEFACNRFYEKTRIQTINLDKHDIVFRVHKPGEENFWCNNNLTGTCAISWNTNNTIWGEKHYRVDIYDRPGRDLWEKTVHETAHVLIWIYIGGMIKEKTHHHWMLKNGFCEDASSCGF